MYFLSLKPAVLSSREQMGDSKDYAANQEIRSMAHLPTQHKCLLTSLHTDTKEKKETCKLLAN